ncbi:Homeobox protein knotted-1-like 1 [Vitis vinifera]|uniref:Homeobox protein knotted-1-like 1 n=1 Tax=Vitis vinifera TaxID=29760 RepID=A0A438DV37_VITVI|nr:Homeobox protein knotted-1-like 1 [Vitis vinifera]
MCHVDSESPILTATSPFIFTRSKVFSPPCHPITIENVAQRNVISSINILYQPQTLCQTINTGRRESFKSSGRTGRPAVFHSPSIYLSLFSIPYGLLDCSVKKVWSLSPASRLQHEGISISGANAAAATIDFRRSVENSNVYRFESVETEAGMSDLIKSQIVNHPRYPNLVSAYIECRKVGAPPEMASLLEEIGRESQPMNSRSGEIGADPELDEFMIQGGALETFDEATSFLSDIESQLSNLCKGALTAGTSGSYYSASHMTSASSTHLSLVTDSHAGFLGLWLQVPMSPGVKLLCYKLRLTLQFQVQAKVNPPLVLESPRPKFWCLGYHTESQAVVDHPVLKILVIPQWRQGFVSIIP